MLVKPAVRALRSVEVLVYPMPLAYSVLFFVGSKLPKSCNLLVPFVGRVVFNPEVRAEVNAVKAAVELLPPPAVTSIKL